MIIYPVTVCCSNIWQRVVPKKAAALNNFSWRTAMYNLSIFSIDESIQRHSYDSVLLPRASNEQHLIEHR